MKPSALVLSVLISIPGVIQAMPFDLGRVAISVPVSILDSLDASISVGGSIIRGHASPSPTALRPGRDTDLFLDPASAPARGMSPFFGTVQTRGVNNPIRSLSATNMTNAVRAFFNSTSGGFGFRLGYDRRLTSNTRMIAGTEFLTFGLLKSFDRLGSQMPEGVTRITLVSFPFGLQQQLGPEGRVVPHVGIAGGPILRFDHRALANTTPSFGIGSTYPGYRYGGSQFSLGLPLDDFPSLSLTLGGHVEAGFDVRVGEDRSFAVTVDGRYALARFTDALGHPGDFGGFGFTIGIGKYF